MIKLNKHLLFCIIALCNPLCLYQAGSAEENPFKIGWIGSMSGALAKYGSDKAALLAMEEVNANGGINNRPLQLIFEDGKANGAASASAATRLIASEQIKYLIGGHCSPESLAIAPIAERLKVLMLAAITSNPMLTMAGDYIFRITAVSLVGADLVSTYIVENELRNVGVLFGETDYARPLAERVRDNLLAKGIQVVFDSYAPDETEFRSILTRMRSKKIDALYISSQSPDSTALILEQLKELSIKVRIFGNEIAGNAITAVEQKKHLFEEMIYAEPYFDINRPETKSFIESYKTKYKVAELPYGIWTAEAYDAVKLLAFLINKCGDNIDAVKMCLYQVKDYQGASGPISIDKNGDGLRRYYLKQIIKGVTTTIAGEAKN